MKESKKREEAMSQKANKEYTGEFGGRTRKEDMI